MTKTDYTKPFKFTKGSINGIPSGDNLAYFYDTEVPKLGITRQASGNKNFHVRKVVKGRTQRISLKDGKWPDMAVNMAREKAIELLSDVIKGADPVLVTVSDCGGEDMPTSISPKLRAELDSDT